MVLDDVATDHVDDLAAVAAVAAPDLLPVVLLGADALGVLLRGRDVLDRGVDPDVQHEVVLPGVVDPPVHVSGDTPVL